MGEVARELAAQLGCVTAVTGVVDYVSDGERVISVHNGHPLMGRVTGTGCMSTTLGACYCAAGEPYLEGAAAALAIFGITGELAAERVRGQSGYLPRTALRLPGRADPEVIRERARLE